MIAVHRDVYLIICLITIECNTYTPPCAQIAPKQNQQNRVETNFNFLLSQTLMKYYTQHIYNTSGQKCTIFHFCSHFATNYETQKRNECHFSQQLKNLPQSGGGNRWQQLLAVIIIGIITIALPYKCYTFCEVFCFFSVKLCMMSHKFNYNL